MDNEYGLLDELAVTVLLEDCAGYDKGLVSQHGLSLLLEARAGSEKKTILFDCGQEPGPVLQNMALLGHKPSAIEIIFLSHCHYDHTGGLTGILEACDKSPVPVICHPSVHRLNIATRPSFRVVGMGPDNSPGAIESAGGKLIPVAVPLPLMKGAVTSGEINERVSFENTPTLSILTIEDGKTVPDRMNDDQSLIFLMRQGLVIVTGCSHAGIISIIKAAVRLTGIEKIAAVVGGFHLVDAGEERIEHTLDALSGLDSTKIYTGHCTGLKAEAKMLLKLKERFRKLHTGMKMQF